MIGNELDIPGDLSKRLGSKTKKQATQSIQTSWVTLGHEEQRRQQKVITSDISANSPRERRDIPTRTVETASSLDDTYYKRYYRPRVLGTFLYPVIIFHFSTSCLINSLNAFKKEKVK
ncbi:MAG: hypothetical protein ACFFCZ_14640 [Promethearchaeota archaeon]